MFDQPLAIEAFDHDIARTDQRGRLDAIRLHLRANRIGNVQHRHRHRRRHAVIDLVHRIGPDQDRGRTRLLQPLGAVFEHTASARPFLGARKPDEVGEIEVLDEHRGAGELARPRLHQLVDVVVIGAGRNPAHAADQADLAQRVFSPRDGRPLSPQALRKCHFTVYRLSCHFQRFIAAIHRLTMASPAGSMLARPSSGMAMPPSVLPMRYGRIE